jgi:hypothetical protein
MILGASRRWVRLAPSVFVFAFFQNYFRFFDLKMTRLSLIFYIFGI